MWRRWNAWRPRWPSAARRGGRLFILGVGGSAANASHAVNDFRKICGLEAYAPTDNVSELTARTNDEGWAGVFEGWLRVSRLRATDALLIFSVGGGNLEKQVSPNLVAAIRYAKTVGAKVTGIVGRDGGYTAQNADACVIVPTVNAQACHAARRSVSSRDLAPAGDASRAQAGGDQVGIGEVTKAVFLDRDGVLNQFDRARRHAVSARRTGRTGNLPRCGRSVAPPQSRRATC